MKKVLRLLKLVFLYISLPVKFLWAKTQPIRSDWNLMLVERRLHKAKWRAYEYFLRDNGRRYLVLEKTFKPGHYLIMNRDQIKANQKTGFFSDRAKFMDFLNEAAYYTPSAVNFETKKNPFAQKGISLATAIIFMVVVFVGVMVWIKYFKG